MMWRQKTKRFSQVSNSVYLWTAVLIFAASNSVTRKVTEIGAQHLINGRNPISLCNVLFVGNLCALGVMLLIFGKDWNRQTLRQMTRRDWISLGTIAILSGALGPGLIFSALDQTTVTNVVLVGRLEPPLTLALSACLTGARVNGWTVAGSIVSFLGAAITAFLSSSPQSFSLMGGMFSIGSGELFAAIGAFVLALATVTSKLRLQRVPLSIFNLTRVGLGTLLFFILAKLLYGSEHFIDTASPFLWKWMLLYGAVIVVAGQLCWFAGLRSATPAESNLAGSLNPVAAIAMAALILGEVPTSAQYSSGLVILAGIILGLIGSRQEAKTNLQSAQLTPDRQMEMAIGFKGL
ncbi:MAG: DMT family transporter [Leptolyngbyaceae cyanobacterium CSU_1_4]|nr:DMT family transporter [Leptolyngbyaceae cyanobacterium CSU_1_4]